MADVRYDVFLSHNSKDKPAVERIAEKLRQNGLEPWLDAWYLPAGEGFQTGLELGLKTAQGCAYFVGGHGPGAWQREELDIAQNLAVTTPGFRLFSVLLPGAPDQFDPAMLPSAILANRTWVDLRDGYEDPERFQRLINAVRGYAMGPVEHATVDKDQSPYLGLQVFNEGDADFFFGRENDTRRLIEKLKGFRFLAVVGPSGSGKSSLVRAGLLPALRNGVLPGSHDWPIRIFTPTARPLDALAGALASAEASNPGQALEAIDRIVTAMRQRPQALDQATTLALSGQPATARFVLVVDQFEEIFTLCTDEEQRARFLDNLLYAATVQDGRCIVIITLRADFYPRCAAYPDLATMLAAHQVLLGPLTDQGLRAVIVEPARRLGVEFEPGLVDRILNDVGKEAGALPLLEHALWELWQRRKGTTLRLADYERSGGVGSALATRADTVYESFPPEQQDVARRILLRLTQPGEETEDTRRRAQLDELITWPGEQDAVRTVIDDLVGARLLTADQQPADGAVHIDVAHEALIRAWPRLREWLDEDREGLRVHRRLTEATHEWERNQRDPDLLYRGARLNEAQALAARHPDRLNTSERAFLDASVALREADLAAEQTRQRAREQQRRRVLIGLAAFSLVALVLAGIAAVKWRESDASAAAALAAQGTAEAEARRADDEASAAIAAQSTAEAEARRADDEAAAAIAAREEAEQQREIAATERDSARAQERLARSRLLATQASSIRRPDLALQLSLEAVRLDPESPETRGNLFTTLAANPNLAAVLPAHAGQILGLAFSPDGTRVATAGSDGVLQVWDATTLDPVGEPLISETTVVLRDPAFSPDGTMLLVAGELGPVLFDMTSDAPASTGRVITPGFPMDVWGFAFSPDSTTLAFATDQGLMLWDIAADAPVGEMVTTTGGLATDVAFSPDGSLLAASSERQVQLWDVATREPVGDPMVGSTVISTVPAFNADGTLLATGEVDGTITVWEVTTREPAYPSWEGSSGTIEDLEFSPIAPWLAATGVGGTVVLWDVATQAEVQGPLIGHESGVYAINFRPDGQVLASAGREGTLVLWNLSADTAISTFLRGARDVVFGVSFSQDGQRLAAAASGAGIEIWDLSTGERVGDPLDSHMGEVWDVAYNPAGTMLLSGAEDGVILWDLRLESPAPERLLDYTGAANSVAISPDGRWLAAAGAAGTMVWDAATLELTQTIPTANDQSVAFGTVAFSPDSTMLATGDASGYVRIYSLPDGVEVAASDAYFSSTVLALTFSPDGHHLALGGIRGDVYIINAATGAAVGDPFPVSDDFVFATAFNQAGTELVVGGENGLVLVDLERRVSIGESQHLAQHVGKDLDPHVTALALSPDGDRVAAGGPDGVIVILDIALERWTDAACGIIRAPMNPETWSHYLGDEPYHETCPPDTRPHLPALRQPEPMVPAAGSPPAI